MLVREKLETRALSGDVDRGSFVALGLDYLQRVSEPDTITPDPGDETGFALAELGAP